MIDCQRDLIEEERKKKKRTFKKEGFKILLEERIKNTEKIVKKIGSELVSVENDEKKPSK